MSEKDEIIQDVVERVLTEIREHLNIDVNDSHRPTGTYRKIDVVQALNLVESEWLD